MLRTAVTGLALWSVACRVPLANQPLSTPSRIASCSRINAVAQATFGTRRSGWSISAARVLSALKINPGNYHLIIIYYYQRSSVYELDVVIPREKDVYGYACDDKLYIKYEGGCFTEFLKEKLENISEGRKRELCLKIAELSGGGRIRGIHTISNKDDCGTFIAEVEVGRHTDWAKNHIRPYQERRNILEKDLGNGVLVRLCEGQYIL